MEWWLGFNQCWPMGKECSVDWDGWALLIAVAAIFISWLGMVVTAASAIAVYWLGRQANAIATATHEIDRDSRQREGGFILAYLYSEVLDAYSSLDSWLEQGEIFRLHFLSLNESRRRDVLEMVYELSLPQAEQKFDRLHVIDPLVGLRLARAMSTIKLLKIALEPLVNLEKNLDAQTRLDATVQHIENTRDDLKFVLDASLRARKFAISGA